MECGLCTFFFLPLHNFEKSTHTHLFLQGNWVNLVVFFSSYHVHCKLYMNDEWWTMNVDLYSYTSCKLQTTNNYNLQLHIKDNSKYMANASSEVYIMSRFKIQDSFLHFFPRSCFVCFLMDIQVVTHLMKKEKKSTNSTNSFVGVSFVNIFCSCGHFFCDFSTIIYSIQCASLNSHRMKYE